MANARPSSPGRTDSERVRPEQNIPKGTKTVEAGGKVFLETEMQNGNIRRTSVFPGDYEVNGKKAKKKG
jgi:hypothetical protein